MENKSLLLDKLTEEEKKLIYKQITSDINRKYRQEKREQIIERYHKKVPCCICSKMIDYTNMSKHRRSKKCMRIKEEIENNKTQNNECTDNDYSEKYISN